MKPMTALDISLAIICQVLIISGQVLFKHAMTDGSGSLEMPSTARPIGRRISTFFLGIVCMSFWFFIWLGLLGRWDLSRLFPFEGANPALMALAAWLLLKERMGMGAWSGLLLVCVGIVIVAAS